MHIATRNLPTRFTFSREFVVIGALVVLASMLVFGMWLGKQIENRVIGQSATLVSSSVENILAAQLHGWSGAGPLPAHIQATLDEVFVNGTLRKKVLDFKLWTADRRIAYSVDHDQIGLAYPFDEQLNAAFGGRHISIIQPSYVRHAPHRQLRAGERQLEVYVPIRIGAGKDEAAYVVAEFDHPVNELDADIRNAQLTGWAMTGLCALVIYALMYGRVANASDTILKQRNALRVQMVKLNGMLEENRRMQEQLRAAAASTTTLNEQFLQRIAADIHDGPVQELAYALLRFGDLEAACHCCNSQQQTKADLQNIHVALDDSLAYLRAIATNMVIPGIETLSIADTARKAVADAETQSEQRAETSIADIDDPSEPALKITLYRLLRESLANAWRHAHPAVPRVSLRRVGDGIAVEIEDAGPGFDPARAMASGRLGLLFMRERVRLAGGTFEIVSAPGAGTRIGVRLPLGRE